MTQLNMLQRGAPLQEAQAALLLLHGRGASAEDILLLAEALVEGLPESSRVAFLLPRAPNNVWYPYPFMSPIQQNEPHLSNALAAVSQAVEQLAAGGVPPEKVLLGGFSQGACLASEWAARWAGQAITPPNTAGSARRLGGLAVFSGGLIGPPGTPFTYPGSLQGTPVFLGCSDVDPHIPLSRVQETARALEALGAQVTTRIYPGMDHTINEDELDSVRTLLRMLL